MAETSSLLCFSCVSIPMTMTFSARFQDVFIEIYYSWQQSYGWFCYGNTFLIRHQGQSFLLILKLFYPSDLFLDLSGSCYRLFKKASLVTSTECLTNQSIPLCNDIFLGFPSFFCLPSRVYLIKGCIRSLSFCCSSIIH